LVLAMMRRDRRHAMLGWTKEHQLEIRQAARPDGSPGRGGRDPDVSVAVHNSKVVKRHDHHPSSPKKAAPLGTRTGPGMASEKQ
jgi:hypothetical protein